LRATTAIANRHGRYTCRCCAQLPWLRPTAVGTSRGWLTALVDSRSICSPTRQLHAPAAGTPTVTASTCRVSAQWPWPRRRTVAVPSGR